MPHLSVHDLVVKHTILRYYLNTNNIDIVIILLVAHPQIVPHATLCLWVLQQIIVQQ